MKKTASLITMYLVICEALIIGLYHFAPCYSPFTGRANLFNVWMQETHILWFSITGLVAILTLIFKRA